MRSRGSGGLALSAGASCLPREEVPVSVEVEEVAAVVVREGGAVEARVVGLEVEVVPGVPELEAGLEA